MISATEKNTAPILIDVVSEDISGWDIVANLGPFAILAATCETMRLSPTDSKLDKETPKWVKDLAAKPL
ncbi:hypothetical protein ASH00_02940 [Arthrobacter sp. Soil782]|uniref:hypothetical protein n=1 Tax=Arthrobacter sp. Soil782 TaxID=1736410 RepID=UPI0006F67F22|nr:hypothetical protein [Arthrobacter sp. Soil782]KRF08672.1 hypothetical protein ASH00_02940 [Arthrobacter sp. Soil782]